jgi:hypothetical protein
MKLVEEQGRGAVERGIALQHARQHTLGDNLDARPRADSRVEPHAVADGLADRLPERLCHAPCHGAGRDAPRLENDEFPALRPGLTEQRERNDGALAGTRRRDEYGSAARAECRAEGGQDFVDG